MSESSNKNLLWHDTAIKLIRYASSFRNTGDEFQRQVGYLLLDVGVETLFRSFLTMPHLKAKLTFGKSDEVAKGTIYKKDFLGEKFTSASFDELSFHKLVEAVRQIAASNVNEDDLEAAEYYHNIRNKLYHLGEGIVPPKAKFDNYIQLAERLLETLLGTNQPTKHTPTDEELEEAIRKFSLDISLAVATIGLQKEFQDFRLNIMAAAENFNPKYTSRRFEKGLKEILLHYPDNEVDSVSDRYENQLERIKGFQKLSGTDIDDIDFIDKVIYDIADLHLVIVQNQTIVDDNDLDNYFKYREFVERFHDGTNNASREDREEIIQLKIGHGK
jgi:hypothetical protein